MLNKAWLVLILGLMVVSASADWGVVGAGNATCEHWNSANQNTKTEILSWMVGFSSAVSIEFASENKHEFRLELLTYEYLTNEIKNACSMPGKSKETIVGILFDILSDFPKREKQ